MLTPDARALTFDEIRAGLLSAAAKFDLEVYAVTNKLDLGTMTRELRFCAVPEDWQAPHSRRAEVKIQYDVAQAALVEDPDRMPEDEADEAELDLNRQVVEAVGLGDDVGPGELETVVRPILDRLNAAFTGGPPLHVDYTLSTDYQGRNLALRASVPYLMSLRLLEHEFDSGVLFKVLYVGLEAIGPGALIGSRIEGGRGDLAVDPTFPYKSHGGTSRAVPLRHRPHVRLDRAHVRPRPAASGEPGRA